MATHNRTKEEKDAAELAAIKQARSAVLDILRQTPPMIAAQVTGSLFVDLVSPVVGAGNVSEGKEPHDADGIQGACDALARDMHQQLTSSVGKMMTMMIAVMMVEESDDE